MRRPTRRNKLPKPGLQLRLTSVFVGVLTLGALLQYILFTSSVMRIAAELPNDGFLLLDRTNGVLLEVLALTFLLFVPLVIWAGVLATFRIAGPLYRFEQYLQAVARGEDPGPCRIRKEDQLHDLCALLSEVTEPLRRRAGAGQEASVAPPAAAGAEVPAELERAPSLLGGERAGSLEAHGRRV